MTKDVEMLGILPKSAAPKRKPEIGANTIISINAHMGLQPLCADPLGEALNSVQMEQKKFKIRLTRETDHAHSANLLIRKMYSWRGYETHASTVSHAPNNICLSVFSAEHAIGTLTLGIDSPEGLSASLMYPQEIDRLRAEGRVLCEITKLAVDQNISSRNVLASLFHIAYIHARHLNGCTDILIEVNPRHVPFYQRMLGFRQLGEERQCPRVKAPAVLLRLETDYVEIQLRKFGGLMENAKNESSLYPYSFSPADEAGIIQRLLRERQ
jgi:hypothetical protein